MRLTAFSNSLSEPNWNKWEPLFCSTAVTQVSGCGLASLFFFNSFSHLSSFNHMTSLDTHTHTFTHSPCPAWYPMEKSSSGIIKEVLPQHLVEQGKLEREAAHGKFLLQSVQRSAAIKPYQRLGSWRRTPVCIRWICAHSCSKTLYVIMSFIKAVKSYKMDLESP